MLPSYYRVTSRRDWQRIYRQGRTVATSALVMKYVFTDCAYSRFGISIGTKISKKAIERNLLKRRWRRSIQLLLPHIQPGYDIVFIARPVLRHLSPAVSHQQIVILFKRAKLLI